MASSTQEHWQYIYQKKDPDEQTWYQRKPTVSLDLIEQVAEELPVRIVDVGGGASTLVDYLLDDGRFDIAVVDIAPAALSASQARLGERAKAVDWRVADLTDPIELDPPVDIWHDRAVLHFLRDPDERAAYLENLEHNIAPDGHVVLSTFAIDGPDKCSGLDIRQYSPRLMSETLGDGWRLVESRYEDHPTPWGGEQRFVYGLFERTA
jgi:2-polyprenyl-3-methyl-5-hydroxy-6-metoxy-1,4-benzoquinol methylase